MSNNENADKHVSKPEAKWYEIPLRDWVILGSVFYFVVSNAGSKAGSEEKLTGFTSSLTEINMNVKEIKQKQEDINDKFSEKINTMNTEIEVLKSRIQSLENK